MSTILILTHEHGRSFHILRFSLVSFFNVLKFSLYKTFSCLARCILSFVVEFVCLFVFYLETIVTGIVFLISFSAYLTLVYRKVKSIGKLMGFEITILSEVKDPEKQMLLAFSPLQMLALDL